MDARSQRRLVAQYPVIFLGNQGGAEGVLSNLSLSGAAIETGEPVPRGAGLTLRVHLPPGPLIVVDQAAVMWTTRNRFGVRFLSLGNREQARLMPLLGDLLQAAQPTEVA